jgi:hypothetical protein
MSKYLGTNSYGHKVRCVDDDYFILSWTVDSHVKNSRIRNLVKHTRHVDSKSAHRFATKWGITITGMESTTGEENA